MEIRSFLDRLPGAQSLNTAKDRLLAKGAKSRFNQLIERYGTMLELELNTAERALSCSLLLKGESTPVEIRINEYALATQEGKTYLEIDGTKIETSREWLTKILNDRLGCQRLFVPENLGWLVQLLG